MLQRYKSEFLQEYFPCQFVLIDEKGVLLESCNTFFDVTDFYGQPAYGYFDFLEHFSPIIEYFTENIYLPRLQINFQGKDQVYDFYFFKDEIKAPNCVFWCIRDVGNDSKHLLQIQQDGREMGIEKEFLELRSKVLMMENALIDQKNKDLERATAFKSKFFSQISHELRSPINGILGLSDLLSELGMDLQQAEFIAGIKSSAKHLRNVLNDVLDISKIEAGKLTFESIAFSLREVFKNLEMAFFADSQVKNIHFVTYIDTQIPAILQGDVTRLTQIFYNLLGNAFKFTAMGEVSLKATWLPSDDENMYKILFQIADTGVGIPQDKLESIFDAYTQAEESTFRNFGGTGLGLSVVKQLIELQKGKVWVESKEKIGTKFSFILDFKLQNELSPQNEKITTYFYNLKALVADDNAVNLLYTKKLLQEAGLEVALARDGREAIELLEKQSFNIVFCDLHMPQATGLEVIAFVRETQKKTPEQLPIVMLTGSASDDENEQQIKAKANAIILKPFQRSDLYNALKLILVENKNTSLFNLKELERVTFGDKQFMLDMLDSTLKNTPLDLEQMKKAAQKRDLEGINKLSHKIKPVASLIGSIEFRKNLEQIEKLSKNTSNQYAVEVLVTETLVLYKKIAEQLQETRTNILAEM